MAGFDVMDNKKEIICPSCGGHFSIHEAKCPYCGAINPIGAEEEYMGKLYDIKDDTEYLPDLAQDEVEEDLLTSSKKTLRFVGITVLICFVLIVLFTALGNRSSNRAMEEYREMEAFKESYFEELNRLYEEENDDELLEYSFTLMDKQGYNAIFNWEHYGYMMSYYLYKELKDWEDEYSTSGNPEDMTYAVYAALDLTRENYYLESPIYAFSKRDMERIEEYQAYAEEFLEKALKMKGEEIDAWSEELKGKKGYIERDQIRKYLKEING